MFKEKLFWIGALLLCAWAFIVVTLCTTNYKRALVRIDDYEVALSSADLVVPTAAGIKTKTTANGIIDYSNLSDGYVMVKVTKNTNVKLKAQVKGPTTYTYNLEPGMWAILPITQGDGSYQVALYEQKSGNKYAMLMSVTLDVKLTDEFAPFIRSNQYVDYTNAINVKERALQLTANCSSNLEKVGAIYDWVTSTYSYDYEKARTVQSGYLPHLEDIYATKKGICFDYAATMVAMLRINGVPAQLVIGYAGTSYHAWINVWSESEGWVQGAAFFNGETWERMDPTFASTGNRSDRILEFINNDANYVEKYLY